MKGVKAIGNKLSTLPVTEVTLEPAMEELEQAHERDLQAARDADAAREAEAKKPSVEPANVDDEGAQADAETDADSAPTESVNDAGQASLF